MKAIFITFNQANTERVEFILDSLKVRGFTFWEEVRGRGSVDGDAHRGTHTWPDMNSAIVTMVDDDKVQDILTLVKKLDKRNTDVGIRAFVWNIEQSI